MTPILAERILILDRDGVVNEDSDDYIKSLDEWRPIPGSIEAIARLSHAGYRIAIASNQSGLARGLFSFSELNAIHQSLNALVAAQGGRIEMIAFCPHAPDARCRCRKPQAGLLDEIAQRMNIALAGVPVIGDTLNDIGAAQAAGAAPWLVLTGKGERTRARIDAHPVDSVLHDIPMFRDLCAVANFLLHRQG